MNNINMFSSNIGALNNAKRALVKVPTGLGGVTVLAGNAYMGAAGTVALNLVDLGTGGTAVSGTIATLGSVVYVADVPQAFTVSTAFVDEGHWIGVEETNVGTCNATTMVDIEYLTGY